MKVTVESEWLNYNLNKKNLIIIDFSWYLPSDKRNPYKEFKNEHIPNAQYIDLENLSDQKSHLPHMLPNSNIFEHYMRLCGVNNDSIIIIYDTKGIWSAPRLWWMFKYFGFLNVYILNGGFKKWKKENRITTNKLIKNQYGNFKTKIISNLLTKKYEIKENLNSKNYKILDARSKIRFLGKISEPRKNIKKGNIPNSINCHWKEFVKDNGTLKNKKEIKSMFNKLRISKNEKIISTCGSGVSACIINLALAENDFNNISVYDGSWSEWGQKNNGL